MDTSVSKNIEAIYPLSPAQQGMVFHSLYAPDSGIYIELLSCEVDGPLDVPAFESAWRYLVDRHSVLRTSFVWKRLDQMLQVVHRQITLPIEYQNWSGMAEYDQQMRLEALVKVERKRGFDLSKIPFRLHLIQTGSERYRFVFVHHHALLDGWSLPIVLGELFAAYEAFRVNRGEHPKLPPVRPYRDYITWLEKQDLAEAERFWRRRLAGFAAPTPLLVHKVDNIRDSAEYEERYLSLPPEATARVQATARRHGITLNTLLQASWALQLGRYSRENDVVFGATVSGRPADLAGSASMVGMFINTLPVRCRIHPAQRVIDWLKEIQIEQADLHQYEYSPLVQVQAWSGIPPTLPLFESILVFENYPVAASINEHAKSLRIRNLRSIERTNYPLTVVAAPGDTLNIRITFDRYRFEVSTIDRALEQVGRFLTSAAGDVTQPVQKLSLLSKAERAQVLHDWNGRACEPKLRNTLHDEFENQVRRTAGAVAVECRAERLTYDELNRRSNQLARYLRQMGVGPDVLVGISIERSIEMMVALLGILKAGGAYVPLDPSYPRDLLAYMVSDSRIAVLITRQSLVDRIPCGSLRLVSIDRDWPAISGCAPTDPRADVSEHNLAYVIYTSGSTGRPKGTLITHRGLTHYLDWCLSAYPLRKGRGSLVHSTIAFDATVTGIFAPLLVGRTVSLVPESERADLLGPMLKSERGFSIIKITPAHLELLGHSLEPAQAAGITTAFVIGGENLTYDQIRFWKSNARDTLLFNEYGPTETVVGCVVFESGQSGEGKGSVPIGRAIHNTPVYVLDGSLEPVPVGVPGELYIGGPGVARGYLNRPELTAEKFVPDFLSGVPGARLYRSGDLVRYLPGGNMEFLGRTDRQVKIRGYRIETGEIETVLSAHPAVRTAVVIAREDQPGDRALVAYIVPRGEAGPARDDLRDYLGARLPEYMVPSAFVILDALPLTPNGKVDRAALPRPDTFQLPSARKYVAARNQTEELLAGIWCVILGVQKVGADDDFFELGGHSLRATQLLSRIRDVFSLELPVRAVFETRTLRALADRIDMARASSREKSALPPLEPVPRGGQMPLSFAQQRLWFLNQLEPEGTSYTIAAALRVTGPLNAAALENCLKEIVRRHEILRTTFAARDGEPVQVIHDAFDFALPAIDLTLPAGQRQQQELQQYVRREFEQNFDLERGPLFRARLLRLAPEEHVVLLAMHHIVSDAWSMGVLVREISELYQAFHAGKQSSLPPLQIQYADFSDWQRRALQGTRLTRQLDFWKELLRDLPAAIELPTDRPRPAVQTLHGGVCSLVFPGTFSRTLAEFSRKHNVTPFMTLLAAFQSLLHRYSGQDDMAVGTAVANRTETATEALIGFFVNTLVLPAHFAGDPPFTDLLRQVRRTCLEAFDHQSVPFERLVEELHPQRDLSRSPLFQVGFAYQNTPSATLDLPGLTIEPLAVPNIAPKYDLTLTVVDEEAGLRAHLEFNADLYDAATIDRMLEHFRTLLEGVLAAPDTRVSALPLMSRRELRQVLAEWNATTADFPHLLCAHEWFENEAAKHPSSPAAVSRDLQLTYSELNHRANQLARRLRNAGVGRGTLVGICMERSLEMVVSIIALWKAGAAFVPLDAAYPSERLAFMIDDAGLPLVLTHNLVSERLASYQARLLNLDDLHDLSQESVWNLQAAVSPDDLAYVIYTSGSTGKPKGTMLQHRGLCNLAAAQIRAFGVGEESRILQFSSLSFDASVWEIVMALLSGGALSLAPRDVLSSGQGLLDVLQRQRITTVTLPPSVLAVLPEAELPDLRVIITAGEKCTADLVSRWGGNRRFFNAYGPTETTVCASMMELAKGRAPQNPPIGRPIANTRIYLLDRKGNPVPAGVPGELAVAGVCIARGYLNRPDLTAEKFLPDTFSGSPGSRLYRTGDLGRHLPDGSIEFLGRIDHQVKLRGFRIEPGEIEASLMTYAGIRDAAVIVREDVPGNRRLVAYVVVDPARASSPADLRAFARGRLPDYMVPSAFVFIEAMPLTPNGKLNRDALPPPDQASLAIQKSYVAPRNPVEQKLASIMSGILAVERVGVNDNFFDLGGHSLMATQIMSRLRSAFGVELPLRSLFETPTVAEMARRVAEAQGQRSPESAPEMRKIDRGRQGIADLLAQLDEISDEDARARLAQEETSAGTK